MKSRFIAYVSYLLGAFFILVVIWVASKEITSTKFADPNISQIRDDIVLMGALDNANSISQTFVSQKPYLSSIQIFLKTDQSEQPHRNNYHLFFHLQDSQHNEIASQNYVLRIPTETLGADFSFIPQSDSRNKKYYLLVETDAPANRLSVWTSLYDAYQNGEIFLNNIPSKFDLTFWVYYTPPFLIWAKETLISAGPRFIRLLFISLVFFSLGLLIYTLLGSLSQNPIEVIIYSLSIGIAMPPILFLMMSFIGININNINILITLIILSASFGAKYLLSPKTRTSKLNLPKTINEEVIFLGLMFLLAAFSRTSQINDLVVPNWVDGIVHQQFITKILEKQSIPFDAIYPKGFHANVIFEYLLFGGALPESILLMGQWLSLMSGLTFYLLARKLLRTPYSLLAVGIYWFWTAFPAFLINWGRYPYLQGLVLLPVIVRIYADNSLNRRLRYTILTLLLVGIGLTYYGAFLIFAAYLITDLINYTSKEGYSELLNKMRGIVLPMMPIIIILLIRLHHSFKLGVYGQDSTVSQFEDSIQAFKISLTHGGWFVWTLGFLGFILALILNHQKHLVMAEWFLILLSLNFFQATFGITISSIANSIIFLSIPLVLLTGFVFKVFLTPIIGRPNLLHYIIIILISFGGAYNISGIVGPSTDLYRAADQKAMKWIEQNTSPNSVFLVNSFLWGNDIAPSDGGGWIPYIAKRKTILFDNNKFEKEIVDRQVDYIYIGRGYGNLNPNQFMTDNRFSLIYNNDDIRVFKLNP